jgi:hypothetical protein
MLQFVLLLVDEDVNAVFVAHVPLPVVRFLVKRNAVPFSPSSLRVRRLPSVPVLLASRRLQHPENNLVGRVRSGWVASARRGGAFL